jgi:hypothetical protein
MDDLTFEVLNFKKVLLSKMFFQIKNAQKPILNVHRPLSKQKIASHKLGLKLVLDTIASVHDHQVPEHFG